MFRRRAKKIRMASQDRFWHFRIGRKIGDLVFRFVFRRDHLALMHIFDFLKRFWATSYFFGTPPILSRTILSCRTTPKQPISDLPGSQLKNGVFQKPQIVERLLRFRTRMFRNSLEIHSVVYGVYSDVSDSFGSDLRAYAG